jgi:aldehyde dehydrogenase (NAD+)
MSTDMAATLARHRTYFLAGKTRPLEWREQQLAAVAAMVTERADEFYKARRGPFNVVPRKP